MRSRGKDSSGDTRWCSPRVVWSRAFRHVQEAEDFYELSKTRKEAAT